MEDYNVSNYEKTRRRAQLEFLKYDQQHMIEQFSLKHDDAYLYLHFVDATYRINRESGCTERLCTDGNPEREAEAMEALSIWDVLCNSRPDAHISGTFGGKMSNTFKNTRVYDSDLLTQELRFIDRNYELLEPVCAAIGTPIAGKGDLNFEFAAFDFLPVRFSYWESDDEFDACFKFYWDSNVEQFLHLETTYYVHDFIVHRLMELMGEAGAA